MPNSGNWFFLPSGPAIDREGVVAVGGVAKNLAASTAGDESADRGDERTG
jgi:hypothetical protein